MSEYSRNTYRLGRRPGEQDPRLLLSNQGRVEKWATGKQAKRSERKRESMARMSGERETMGKLKLVNNVVTVGTWNVQTLWQPENWSC